MRAQHTPGQMTWKRRADGSLFYVIGDHKTGPHAQGDIYIDMPIEPPGRLRFAWNVYRIYRGANRSRKTALHHAWKAFRQPN